MSNLYIMQTAASRGQSCERLIDKSTKPDTKTRFIADECHIVVVATYRTLKPRVVIMLTLLSVVVAQVVSRTCGATIDDKVGTIITQLSSFKFENLIDSTSHEIRTRLALWRVCCGLVQIGFIHTLSFRTILQLRNASNETMKLMGKYMNWNPNTSQTK